MKYLKNLIMDIYYNGRIYSVHFRTFFLLFLFNVGTWPKNWHVPIGCHVALFFHIIPNKWRKLQNMIPKGWYVCVIFLCLIAKDNMCNCFMHSHCTTCHRYVQSLVVGSNFYHRYIRDFFFFFGNWRNPNFDFFFFFLIKWKRNLNLQGFFFLFIMLMIGEFVIYFWYLNLVGLIGPRK